MPFVRTSSIIFLWIHMMLNFSEIKYSATATIWSRKKLLFWYTVRFLKKNWCQILQMSLLNNKFATNVAQNFLGDSLLSYLWAYIISSLSYLHRKSYKRLKFWQRLRGATIVIFNKNWQKLFFPRFRATLFYNGYLRSFANQRNLLYIIRP